MSEPFYYQLIEDRPHRVIFRNSAFKAFSSCLLFSLIGVPFITVPFLLGEFDQESLLMVLLGAGFLLFAFTPLLKRFSLTLDQARHEVRLERSGMVPFLLKSESVRYEDVSEIILRHWIDSGGRYSNHTYHAHFELYLKTRQAEKPVFICKTLRQRESMNTIIGKLKEQLGCTVIGVTYPRKYEVPLEGPDYTAQIEEQSEEKISTMLSKPVSSLFSSLKDRNKG